MSLSRFAGIYIFPGGYLPSTTQLLDHICEQSQGTLTLERVENIGGHYAKALRLWRKKFLLNFDDKIKPAMLRSYPSMSKEAIELFRRKWEVRIISTRFCHPRSNTGLSANIHRTVLL